MSVLYISKYNLIILDILRFRICIQKWQAAPYFARPPLQGDQAPAQPGPFRQDRSHWPHRSLKQPLCLPKPEIAVCIRHISKNKTEFSK